MKNSLHLKPKYSLLCLAGTGLLGATLTWAAPKVQNSRPAPTVKKPSTKNAVVSPTHPITTSQHVTPPTLPTAKAIVASPVKGEVGFTPSRFPGVKVRHLPQNSSFSTSSTWTLRNKPRRGLALKNVRRALNPRDGIVADVDPASFPDEVVSSSPSNARSVAPVTAKPIAPLDPLTPEFKPLPRG